MKSETALSRLREQKNITAMALARKAHIPKTSYYNYESGIKTPNIMSAIKIADALGVKDLRELWSVETTD